MKREKIIESLVNQFAQNITNLSDETLQDVESGKFVISLTPAVDKEAGGRLAAIRVAEKAEVATAVEARRATAAPIAIAKSIK